MQVVETNCIKLVDKSFYSQFASSLTLGLMSLIRKALGNIVAETLFPVDFCHVFHSGQTRKHFLRNTSSHEY